jgi:exopolysaccharide production protein ExoY
MLKENRRTFEASARVVDLGLITAAFVGAAIACEGPKDIRPLDWLPRPGFNPNAASYQYALLLVVSLVSWLAVSQWQGAYRSHRAQRWGPALQAHLTTGLRWMMLTGLGVFLLKLHPLSRVFFLTFLAFGMVLLSMRLVGTIILLQSFRTRGFNLRTAVIVGELERATRLAEIVRNESSTGYRVVGVINSIDAWKTEFHGEKFDEAFVFMNGAASEMELLVLKLLHQAKRVNLVPGLLDTTLFRQELGRFAGLPVLSIGGVGLSKVESVAKRLLDVIASILLLAVFGPIMALVALLIKATSRGPVIFSQERLGKEGRPFWIYKFRTMCADADEQLRADPILYNKYVENNYKLPEGSDPRVTRLGSFLRKTSLDELPQLFNILKGDMSLVGPRPVVPKEIEKYGQYSTLFLSVKPGLTGHWQIEGRSQITDYALRTTLDIEYIRDQSIRNDVHILLRTIPAVLLRRGAH